MTRLSPITPAVSPMLPAAAVIIKLFVRTMAWLLEEAGLSGEAEALLQERMNEAQAPYYFMGWLANIKKDADKADEAVVWYRKAYDESRGRYSRFRWEKKEESPFPKTMSRSPSPSTSPRATAWVLSLSMGMRAAVASV